MSVTTPISATDSTRKPQARVRRRETCSVWLDSLEPSDVRSRLLVSGNRGFYEHERLWIARHCQYAGCCESAQVQLAAKAERAQELKRACAVGQNCAKWKGLVLDYQFDKVTCCLPIARLIGAGPLLRVQARYRLDTCRR